MSIGWYMLMVGGPVSHRHENFIQFSHQNMKQHCPSVPKYLRLKSSTVFWVFFISKCSLPSSLCRESRCFLRPWMKASRRGSMQFFTWEMGCCCKRFHLVSRTLFCCSRNWTWDQNRFQRRPGSEFLAEKRHINTVIQNNNKWGIFAHWLIYWWCIMRFKRHSILHTGKNCHCAWQMYNTKQVNIKRNA